MSYTLSSGRTSLANSTVDRTPSTNFAITVISLCAVVGTVGNVMTIVAIATHKTLRIMYNYYVVNLAVVDLIVTSVLYPSIILTLVTKRQPPLCDSLVPFVGMVLATVSNFNLSAIAFNRYVAITKSQHTYKRLFSKWRCLLSIALMWIVSGLISLPPLIGFGEYGYDRRFGVCFMLIGKLESYWYLVFIGVVFSLPFTLIAGFSYTKIILKFYRVQRRRRSGFLQSALAPKTTVPELPVSPPTSQERLAYRPISSAQLSYAEKDNRPLRFQKRQQREMFRVAFTCVAIWLMHLILWTPVLMLFIIDSKVTVDETYYRVLFPIACLNFVVNPIFYAGMNRNFRKAYKTLFLCHCWFKRENLEAPSSFVVTVQRTR